MRKLLAIIRCAGLLLLLLLTCCIMLSKANASDCQIVIDTVDGNPYAGANLDPAVAHDIVVKINIINWTGGADPIFASNVGFKIAPAGFVTFIEGSPTAAAPWGDPAFSGVIKQVPNESYVLTIAAFSCAAVTEPFLVYTVGLQTVAGQTGTVTLSAQSGPDADYNISVGVGNCKTPTEYRDGGTGTAAFTLAPETTTTTEVSQTTTSAPDNGGGGSGGGGSGSKTTTSSQPGPDNTGTTTTTSQAAAPDSTTTTAGAEDSSSTTSVAPPPPGLCAAEELYGAGSEDVAILRTFRDEVLSKSPVGQRLIALYYTWSPLLVQSMRNNPDYGNALKMSADNIISLIKFNSQIQQNSRRRLK